MKAGEQTTEDDWMNNFGKCLVLVVAGFLAACSQKPEEPAKPVGPREIAVTVEKMSYAPASVEASANEDLKFVFTRVSESRCGEEIVFPDYGIKKTLPLNQPVEIAIKTKSAGTIGFACGMDMMKGTIVVQ